MNRAWIPAGALAGVSVAGLIALGALTDSLGTPVPFQTSVEVTTQAGTPSKSVPVSYTKGNAGTTTTAALSVRGGQALNLPDTNSTTGVAGYRKYTPVKVASSPPPAKETSPPPKPTVKRTAVGTDAPNGAAGLASGGSNSTTGSGEQSGTPSSDGQ